MILEVKLRSGGFVRLECDENAIEATPQTIAHASEDRKLVVDLLTKLADYAQARMMLPFTVEKFSLAYQVQRDIDGGDAGMGPRQ